jgi:hypothetical protein
MKIRYWIQDDRIHFSSETSSGTFTANDTEGLYANYQQWLADGNTPEEWQSNIVQPESEN